MQRLSIVLALLGSLAGCGGGGGGEGDGTTTVPLNTTPTLRSIEVTPSLSQAAAGTEAQFTATGVYTDNSKKDLTTQATWASSDSAVAMLSNAAGSKGLAIAAGVGSAKVSATSDGVSGDTMLTVTDATLVSIEVSPAAPSIVNGLTQQFTATGLYSDNSTQDLTTQVTWASSDNVVATMSNAAGSNGLATADSVGSTTVSATSDDVSGDTTLTVTDATLVSIEVSPATPSIVDGLTQQFTATGLYSDNSTQDLTTEVIWNSSDSAVATVSNTVGSKGLATAASVGGTTVSATSDGVSGDTTLTVTDATLVSIEVSPAASSLVDGLTQQFTATGLYSDNSTQDLTTEVTWASSDSAVATVSNAVGSNGLATAASVGSTTVSATSGDVSGDTTLAVTDATLVSIEVTPAAPSIANGLTQQFTATGLYSDNSTQDLTTEVTWSSSDSEVVATVSNAPGVKGLATATGIGSTTVSATSDGVTGDTMLTVTDATLVSIEVTPATPSVVNGLTQQFTATGTFSDNSTQDLTTEVTWASSDSEVVATVSNAPGVKGLATAIGIGSTTVSATSDGVTGDTMLTVTDATLVSIEVTPATPSVVDGFTQQFTATGTYSDNSTQDLTTEVTWASSDSLVATVSNAVGSNGLATAASVGGTTVSATSDGVTGDTTLTVTDATLVSIEVTPADAQHRGRLHSAVHGDRHLLGQLDAGPHDSGYLGFLRHRGRDGEQRPRFERPRDRGQRRQHHRVCDQRRRDRRYDLDGDRCDAGVDRSDTGDAQHRGRLHSAVHGNGNLLGQLDTRPHDPGHLGLLRHRGGDGERRPRFERFGDRSQRRQHHRVCDQRRRDRRYHVDGDRVVLPCGESTARGSAPRSDRRRAGSQSGKQGDRCGGLPCSA